MHGQEMHLMFFYKVWCFFTVLLLTTVESTATTYSWFRRSSLAIILLGIWSWLYYSFGFLFCLNSLVNLVLYTFRMTEFKAPSLVLRCTPLLRFSLLTICDIYYAWSPLSKLRGLLRGLRQMLSKSLNSSCSKDKGNFLTLCAQFIFWNAI